MKKEYPDYIKSGKFKFKKYQDQIFLKFKLDIKKDDVEKFLKDKKEVIQWQFEDAVEKDMVLKRFNKASIYNKVVKRSRGWKESIDQLIEQLEKDERIYLAHPVYYRGDLKYPNGFTFDDQIIIKLKEEPKDSILLALFKEIGVEKVEGPLGSIGKNKVLLRLLDNKNQNIFDVAKKFDESKLIKSTNINIIQLHFVLSEVPNDTHFNNQWNLHNTGQTMPDGNTGTPNCDINVDHAWDISKGSPLVVIAILDTGCDLNHEDIIPNFVQQDRWYNFETNTNSPDDDAGHGTSCAGIASAQTNSLNTQGVAGVGWKCRIMPLRMIWNNGKTTDVVSIVAALNWALENGADIISMSWHWDGGQVDIDDMLEDCYDEGIVLIAASGNSAVSDPDFISYPASNSHVIAVGATNENDWRCTNLDWSTSTTNGSQFGPELSVVAPGVHIWSTDMSGLGAGYNSANGGGDAAGNYTEDFGGTSGATPHVAGLAGLILAYNPNLTPHEVRDIIEKTADDLVGDPTEDTAGWDKYMGHGRINAFRSLEDVRDNHPFTPADVYIRDSLTDTGVEPYAGFPLYSSPDIIIRKTPVGNPQNEFINMTVDPGSDNVVIGSNNYIYIRIHNKGTINSDIHVKVYFAPLTGSCAPDLWEYIGQIDFYNILPNQDAVSDALIWESVPDPGDTDHFCIIASIEGFGDPHPDPSGITSAIEYMDFIRIHNNLCYRNIVFENVLTDTIYMIKFIIPGFKDAKNQFDFRIIRDDFPFPANVILKFYSGKLKNAQMKKSNFNNKSEKLLKGFREFEFKDEKQALIKDFIVYPQSRNIAFLETKIPANAEIGKKYHLTLQQLYEGKVIGDFHIIFNIIDLNKVKYIAIRGSNLVHKSDCKNLLNSNRQLWIPFESLEEAKGEGYDMAIDCLNLHFTSKDVSYKLSRRVMHLVNKIKLPVVFYPLIKDSLDLNYFKSRYGVERAKKKRFDLKFKVLKILMKAREKFGRFNKLGEIEALEGLSSDDFIDIVNMFK